MTEFDREYLKLVKKILEEGIETENRTGINTIKIPEYTFNFDLRKGDPILTTKQFFARQAITEMLWIWQMSSNDVRQLKDRNVHIWDEWMVDEDGIYRIYEPFTKEDEYDEAKEVNVIDPLSVPIDDPFGIDHEFTYKLDDNGKIMTAKSLIPGKNIKSAKYYGKEFAYTIGTAYGFITGRYNFAKRLISTLKKKPEDRRMVFSLWQDEFLREAVLPSCVWSTEWGVTGNDLNLLVHQRSCDVPLGLPFNVTQYACLLKMIAKDVGLNASTVTYSIKDPHIYVNQIAAMKEQLRRQDKYDELSLLSGDELKAMKKKLEDDILKLDNNTEEYKIMDSDIRIIDMILDPVTPNLWLDPSIDSFFDYDNSKELKNVKIKNYKHMGKLPMDVAQ